MCLVSTPLTKKVEQTSNAEQLAFISTPSRPPQKKLDTQCAQNCWRSEWNEARQKGSRNSKHINGRALNAIQESFFGQLDIYLITPARRSINKQKSCTPSRFLFRAHEQKVEDARFINYGRRTPSTQPPYVFTLHLMKFARINNIHPRPNGRTSCSFALSRGENQARLRINREKREWWRWKMMERTQKVASFDSGSDWAGMWTKTAFCLRFILQKGTKKCFVLKMLWWKRVGKSRLTAELWLKMFVNENWLTN
jgi:hypothetical protein